MWLCWFCTKLDMMSIGTGNTIVLERRLRTLVTHSHSTFKQLKKSEYELVASVLPPPVVLRGDAVESLQVAQLQRRGTLDDDLGGLPQRPARLVLALGRDNLGPGLPGSLGLGSHGPHELGGHPDVLHLHPLHLDSPGLRGLV